MINPSGKKNKKNKLEDISEDLFYKFEDEHFLKDSEVNLSYKIPYDKKFLDFQENTNEPQYYNICFIKTDKFVQVIDSLNKQ